MTALSTLPAVARPIDENTVKNGETYPLVDHAEGHESYPVALPDEAQEVYPTLSATEILVIRNKIAFMRERIESQLRVFGLEATRNDQCTMLIPVRDFSDDRSLYDLNRRLDLWASEESDSLVIHLVYVVECLREVIVHLTPNEPLSPARFDDPRE